MNQSRRQQLDQGSYNRDRVIELRNQHPEMTLQELGAEVSLSKERVRQILSKAELPTISSKMSPTFTTKAKPIQPCLICGNVNKQRVGKHAKYCSNECAVEARTKYWKQFHLDNPDRRTTYVCVYCGKHKTVRTGIYERQVREYDKLYCSHYCSIKAQWADNTSTMRNQARYS